MRLVAAQRRELVLRRRWMLATRLAALSFAAWYLTLLIVLGHMDPLYQLVNVAAVTTGVSAVVTANYFDPLLLLRNLHRPETATAANWEALQAIRHELLPPIVQDFGVPEGPERDRLVHHADAAELVQRTAPKMRRDRRKFGRIYLAVYLVLASTFIVAICAYDPNAQ